jgi:hypothetical protein
MSEKKLQEAQVIVLVPPGYPLSPPEFLAKHMPEDFVEGALCYEPLSLWSVRANLQKCDLWYPVTHRGGVDLKSLSAPRTEMADVLQAIYAFSEVQKDLIFLTEPLQLSSGGLVTDGTNVGEEIGEHRDLPRERIYLKGGGERDKLDDPAVVHPDEDDEPDASQEERQVEIRTALRESRELGEQTKQQIESLVQRSV